MNQTKPIRNLTAFIHNKAKGEEGEEKNIRRAISQAICKQVLHKTARTQSEQERVQSNFEVNCIQISRCVVS